MNNVIQLINECQYLFLNALTEPQDNALLVVVDEARISHETHDLQMDGRLISAMNPIEVDKNSQRFSLSWSEYIMYSVTNESYAASNDEEIFEGKLFRKYSKSFFLEYAKKGTFASDEYPGVMHHWEVACLNHIVNVISHVEPVISVV